MRGANIDRGSPLHCTATSRGDGTSPASTPRPPLPFFCHLPYAAGPPRQTVAISLIGLCCEVRSQIASQPPQRPRHVTACIDSFGCMSCERQGDDAEGGDGVQHVFPIQTIQIPRILKTQWLKPLGISVIIKLILWSLLGPFFVLSLHY